MTGRRSRFAIIGGAPSMSAAPATSSGAGTSGIDRSANSGPGRGVEKAARASAMGRPSWVIVAVTVVSERPARTIAVVMPTSPSWGASR